MGCGYFVRSGVSKCDIFFIGGFVLVNIYCLDGAGNQLLQVCSLDELLCCALKI